MNRALAFSALLAVLPMGCNETALTQPPADSGPPLGGLSAKEAGQVLAKVDDHAITLGDFAKTLERMDQFDRLRYQTKERRRELLGEMIDVELLAAEARRRGLDKDPETQDQIRGILRDAMLAKAREGMPSPAQISADEVRAYYDSHLDKFSEPERRRVAAIVMTDKKEAQKVLKEAQKASTPGAWGELFGKHSVTAKKGKPGLDPAELAGDLGIVGPPDDPKGSNPNVPEPVRAAAFKMGGPGSISAELIEVEGRQMILRINGVTAAHKRSLAESDRSIRVLLTQEKMAERDKALEDELRKKYPVQIDDKALGAIKVPEGMGRWFAMDSKLWPESEPGADAVDGGAPLPGDGGAPADTSAGDGGR
ncbi:MAG: peptidyl-prolyl cis-trans isomerase [Byssovorax sp.]